MTTRATFTEAELARAIRAAAKLGKVAIQTRLGIAFVDPEAIEQTAAEASPVDDWFRQNGEDRGEGH